MRHLPNEALIHQQLTAGGAVQSTDQMEKRALSRPARPHDDSKLPFRDVQRDAVKGDDFVVTLPVNFANIDATNHAVGCSGDAQEQRSIERWAFFAFFLEGLEFG